MQTVNDVATSLNANYKDVYGETLEQLVPEGVKLLTDMKFSADERQGGTFNQAVGLGLEQSISFEEGDAVLNLNSAIAGKLENAQVSGYQIVGRAQFSWTTASRAVSGGPKAYRAATQIVLENLMRSVKKKTEALLWYGQSGLGTVDSVSGNDITLTVASSAEGIWVGMTNMPIDSYNSTTLRKSNMKITAVTLESTGAVTLTVDDAGSTAANDTIHFYNSYGKQFLGVDKILTTTGSTLFGISQTAYPDLWQGTTYAVGGNLTYAKIIKGLTKVLPKGGEGRFKIYCHPESWQDVANEPEILPTGNMDSRYTPRVLEKGFESIKFHSVAGVVELLPSTYVKRGDAFGLLQDGSWKRIGSTDITMKAPGVSNGDVFMPLENTAAFEVRCYADFAPFCDRPAASIKYTGITQSA